MTSPSRQSLNNNVDPAVRAQLDRLGLLFYDELSEEAKQVAFNYNLFTAEQVYLDSVDAQRSASKAFIHQAINQTYRIRNLIRQSRYLKRYRNDKAFLESTILENLTMFNEEGIMFLFTELRFVNEPK